MVFNRLRAVISSLNARRDQTAHGQGSHPFVVVLDVIDEELMTGCIAVRKWTTAQHERRMTALNDQLGLL